MRRFLAVALLAAAGAVLAAGRAAAPEPPPELLKNLDFFQDYADTAEDGMWEAFDVVSSTQAFPAESAVRRGKEEAP